MARTFMASNGAQHSKVCPTKEDAIEWAKKTIRSGGQDIFIFEAVCVVKREEQPIIVEDIDPMTKRLPEPMQQVDTGDRLGSA